MVLLEPDFISRRFCRETLKLREREAERKNCELNCLDMEKSKYKVESGIQLLTRLSAKKTKLDNFYPNLFQTGPKSREVIEIFSNRSSSFLMMDIICEALLSSKFRGTEIGVLILNTDGHTTLQAITTLLQSKLTSQHNLTFTSDTYQRVLKDMLDNLFIIDVFDATQLYTTFQNLDNILRKHSNISLCVIDTITAFYWSEQRYKITKMDVYLKNLLKIIRKAIQGHELTIMYTRPEYFSSNKDLLVNLEPCVESPTAERVNCRVQLLHNEDDTFTTSAMTYNNIVTRNFRLEGCHVVWM